MLEHLQANVPQRYTMRNVNQHQLLCYNEGSNGNWKVCVPRMQLNNMIQWYHLTLGYLGMTGLFNTISLHFHNPNLQRQINEIVQHCDPCQRYKLPGPGYRELPPRNTISIPWHEVANDLIGPWKITDTNGQDLEFNQLTIIDTVTNLVELVWIVRKKYQHITN